MDLMVQSKRKGRSCLPATRLGMLAVFLLICLQSACMRGGGLSSSDYARAPDPRKHPYVIGVADVVAINVWKDENLSTESPVRPDGTLTMPLVGDLQAVGKTTFQLRDEIAKKLGAYVKDAVVTVAVKEVNSYRFTVTGNAERPGMFSSRYYVTVSEAIALAGGVNRYGSTDDVVVVRAGTDGRPRRIPVDYEAILRGEHPEQDIVILAGDNVQIP
jgi:polysaccharide biosynthesis/export protein